MTFTVFAHLHLGATSRQRQELRSCLVPCKKTSPRSSASCGCLVMPSVCAAWLRRSSLLLAAFSPPFPVLPLLHHLFSALALPGPPVPPFAAFLGLDPLAASPAGSSGATDDALSLLDATSAAADQLAAEDARLALSAGTGDLVPTAEGVRMSHVLKLLVEGCTQRVGGRFGGNERMSVC